MKLILNKKLVFFAGKGGTGKTSCAAATALYAAKKGKNTLVISTDPAHSLGDSFEKKVESQATKIEENLSALELNAEKEFVKFKKRYWETIKEIAVEGTYFTEQEIQQFFALSLPGLDELMALLRIMELVKEEKFDFYVVDTAPSGHTFRLLETPQLLLRFLHVLNEMRQKHRTVVSMMMGRYVKDDADKFLEKLLVDLQQLNELLLDSGKTAFVPVMIAEEMALQETLDLVFFIGTKKIKAEAIVVNALTPKSDCGFCSARAKLEEKHLQEIKKKFKAELVALPLFPTEVKGATLEQFGKALFGEKYSIPKPAKAAVEKAETASASLKPLLEKPLKLVFFGGKGGTGKTSCAAAFALKASESRKVIIISTDPAHSLSDSFRKPVSGKPTKLRSGLFGLEIDAKGGWERFKERYKRQINEFFDSVVPKRQGIHIEVGFDRQIIADLIDLAPPGLDELMALKQLIDLMKSKQFDLFVLDTAPTGHALRLLETPGLVLEWLNALISLEEKFLFSESLDAMLRELHSTVAELAEILKSKETEFVSVTIPEALAVVETHDLVKKLAELKIQNSFLVINKLVPENNCGFCAGRRQQQLKHVKEFTGFGKSFVVVPLFEQEIVGEQQLKKLAKKLFYG